jgi:HD-GYP domain-containing protein (c-di-GMP phosphodiesterase class II)
MKQGTDQRAKLEAAMAAKRQRHAANTERHEMREAIAKRVKARFRFANLTEEPIQALCRICILRAIREDRDGEPSDRQPKKGQEEASLDAGPERTGASSADALAPIQDLDALLAGNGGLPTLPVVFSHLVDLLSDETSSAQAIGDVIGADPALSAKLLRLANSPYYGIPSRVETISRAVTIIGVKELYSVALTVSVIHAFKDIPHQLVDMASFWRHSVTCGAISRAIGELKRTSGQETLFVAGLLHDIGRLLLYQGAPLHARAALARARHSGIPLFQTEKEVIGLDHAEIGGQVLSSSGEVFVPPFQAGEWKTLSLSPEEIALVIGKSEIKAEEMIGALMGEDGP